jgi:hypothetical protein
MVGSNFGVLSFDKLEKVPLLLILRFTAHFI